MNDFISIYLILHLSVLSCSLSFFLIEEAITSWKNGKINRLYTLTEIANRGGND